MAKRLVAVTNVKHNGDFFEAGATLDRNLFTNDQLRGLYDAGAVRIEDDPEENPAVLEDEESAEATKNENPPDVG